MMHQVVVDEMVLWIDENIQTVNISTIAKRSGYSPFYFQRMFKKLMNITLGKYILYKRMEFASYQLLNTNDQILNIAISVGFSSQQTFHRSFTKYFKVAPGVYRRQLGNSK